MSRSAPGPGAYEVAAASAMGSGFEAARRRAVGRNGVFGSTDRRFNPAPLGPDFGGNGMDGPTTALARALHGGWTPWFF